MSALAVVANREPVAAITPGDGAFDDPPMSAEVLAGLEFSRLTTPRPRR